MKVDGGKTMFMSVNEADGGTVQLQGVKVMKVDEEEWSRWRRMA